MARGGALTKFDFTFTIMTFCARSMADRLDLTEGPVDLALQASFDTFRGQRRLSLKLKDLRAAA